MDFAPIVIFAFNRKESLVDVVSSVLNNREAVESDLFVFVDGPRPNKRGEREKVEAVKEYVKKIKGFKSVTYTFSEYNKGLGNSIISGVSSIVEKYGKVIVLEDDLVVSCNFLAYMNQGLTYYKDIQDIFCISAYTDKIKIPQYYVLDSYTCVRGTSWGWGIWNDRWNTIDWNLDDWDSVKRNKKLFNKWGGSDCFGILKDWKYGRNQSWAIRYNYSQFIQNKLSVFPIISKVRNDGFDGSGTNCKSWSRNKFVFDKSDFKDFKWPEDLTMDKKLYKSAMSYNTIFIRIISRIMYIIYPIYLKIFK